MVEKMECSSASNVSEHLKVYIFETLFLKSMLKLALGVASSSLQYFFVLDRRDALNFSSAIGFLTSARDDSKSVFVKI